MSEGLLATCVKAIANCTVCNIHDLKCDHMTTF